MHSPDLFPDILFMILWLHNNIACKSDQCLACAVIQTLFLREIRVIKFMNFTEHSQPAGCGIFCIFPWLVGFGRTILYIFVILCWCHLCKYKWTLYDFTVFSLIWQLPETLDNTLLQMVSIMNKGIHLNIGFYLKLRQTDGSEHCQR